MSAQAWALPSKSFIPVLVIAKGRKRKLLRLWNALILEKDQKPGGFDYIWRPKHCNCQPEPCRLNYFTLENKWRSLTHGSNQTWQIPVTSWSWPKIWIWTNSALAQVPSVNNDCPIEEQFTEDYKKTQLLWLAGTGERYLIIKYGEGLGSSSCSLLCLGKKAYRRINEMKFQNDDTGRKMIWSSWLCFVDSWR